MWLCGLNRCRLIRKGRVKQEINENPASAATSEQTPVDPGKDAAALCWEPPALLAVLEHLPYPVSLVVQETGQVILQNQSSVTGWGDLVGENTLLACLFRLSDEEVMTDAMGQLSACGKWKGLVRVQPTWGAQISSRGGPAPAKSCTVERQVDGGRASLDTLAAGLPHAKVVPKQGEAASLIKDTVLLDGTKPDEPPPSNSPRESVSHFFVAQLPTGSSSSGAAAEAPSAACGEGAGLPGAAVLHPGLADRQICCTGGGEAVGGGNVPHMLGPSTAAAAAAASSPPGGAFPAHRADIAPSAPEPCSLASAGGWGVQCPGVVLVGSAGNGLVGYPVAMPKALPGSSSGRAPPYILDYKADCAANAADPGVVTRSGGGRALLRFSSSDKSISVAATAAAAASPCAVAASPFGSGAATSRMTMIRAYARRSLPCRASSFILFRGGGGGAGSTQSSAAPLRYDGSVRSSGISGGPEDARADGSGSYGIGGGGGATLPLAESATQQRHPNTPTRWTASGDVDLQQRSHPQWYPQPPPPQQPLPSRPPSEQQAALLQGLSTSAWATMLNSPRASRPACRTASVQMLCSPPPPQPATGGSLSTAVAATLPPPQHPEPAARLSCPLGNLSQADVSSTGALAAASGAEDLQQQGARRAWRDGSFSIGSTSLGARPGAGVCGFRSSVLPSALESGASLPLPQGHHHYQQQQHRGAHGPLQHQHQQRPEGGGLASGDTGDLGRPARSQSQPRFSTLGFAPREEEEDAEAWPRQGPIGDWTETGGGAWLAGGIVPFAPCSPFSGPVLPTLAAATACRDLMRPHHQLSCGGGAQGDGGAGGGASPYHSSRAGLPLTPSISAGGGAMARILNITLASVGPRGGSRQGRAASVTPNTTFSLLPSDVSLRTGSQQVPTASGLGALGPGLGLGTADSRPLLQLRPASTCGSGTMDEQLQRELHEQHMQLGAAFAGAAAAAAPATVAACDCGDARGGEGAGQAGGASPSDALVLLPVGVTAPNEEGGGEVGAATGAGAAAGVSSELESEVALVTAQGVGMQLLHQSGHGAGFPADLTGADADAIGGVSGGGRGRVRCITAFPNNRANGNASDSSNTGGGGATLHQDAQFLASLDLRPNAVYGGGLGQATGGDGGPPDSATTVLLRSSVSCGGDVEEAACISAVPSGTVRDAQTSTLTAATSAAAGGTGTFGGVSSCGGGCGGSSFGRCGGDPDFFALHLQHLLSAASHSPPSAAQAPPPPRQFKGCRTGGPRSGSCAAVVGVAATAMATDQLAALVGRPAAGAPASCGGGSGGQLLYMDEPVTRLAGGGPCVPARRRPPGQGTATTTAAAANATAVAATAAAAVANGGWDVTFTLPSGEAAPQRGALLRSSQPLSDGSPSGQQEQNKAAAVAADATGASAAPSSVGHGAIAAATTGGSGGRGVPAAASPVLPPAAAAMPVAPVSIEAQSASDAADGECEWHEVTLTAFLHPQLRRRVVLIVQNDVSERIWAERQLVRVVEAEHTLLENIFPHHVIEHIATKAAKAGGGRGGGGSERSTPDLAVLNARLSVAAKTALTTKSAAATHNPQQQQGGGEEGGPSLPLSAAAGPPGGGNKLPAIRGSTFLHLATSHSVITVLFCDIQGFTPMCNEVRPVVVMAFLNDLFTCLDALLDSYGVYKVETIGDCYVAAGGLMKVDDETGAVTVRSHDVDPQHAARTVQFAKALLRAASAVVMPTTGQPVRLRVGIHSGPAMSGVVGSRMPRFCLFGDTMNTASRMESTGVPGAIHVSASTRDLAPGEDWEATGGVQVKGKGLMKTFLLRPPLGLPPLSSLSS